MARGSSPESPGRRVSMIGLLYCFMMRPCFPPALRDMFSTPMARYSLFVLKLPLNTHKPNQTNH